jgi:hypothetical protein
LDVVEPGVVQITLWRPDGEVREGLEAIWVVGGIGPKP